MKILPKVDQNVTEKGQGCGQVSTDVSLFCFKKILKKLSWTWQMTEAASELDAQNLKNGVDTQNLQFEFRLRLYIAC